MYGYSKVLMLETSETEERLFRMKEGADKSKDFLFLEMILNEKTILEGS
jgi:hypothetical protein